MVCRITAVYITQARLLLLMIWLKEATVLIVSTMKTNLICLLFLFTITDTLFLIMAHIIKILAKGKSVPVISETSGTSCAFSTLKSLPDCVPINKVALFSGELGDNFI